MMSSHKQKALQRLVDRYGKLPIAYLITYFSEHWKQKMVTCLIYMTRLKKLSSMSENAELLMSIRRYGIKLWIVPDASK